MQVMKYRLKYSDECTKFINFIKRGQNFVKNLKYKKLMKKSPLKKYIMHLSQSMRSLMEKLEMFFVN